MSEEQDKERRCVLCWARGERDADFEATIVGLICAECAKRQRAHRGR